MDFPFSNETEFSRQTEDWMEDCVCKQHVWWDLSTADSNRSQLAFSICNARTTHKKGTCLNVALGFQKRSEANCRVSINLKILCKTKQFGYWENFPFYKKPIGEVLYPNLKCFVVTKRSKKKERSLMANNALNVHQVLEIQKSG